MTDLMTSPTGFYVLIALFAIGGMGSLLFRKHDTIANGWSAFFAMMGSLWGMLFAVSAWSLPQPISFTFGDSFFPLFSASITIDTLSAFFIAIISLITFFCTVYGISYVKHFYGKYNIGTLGFFYSLFIMGMLLVVTASNGLFFLVAWEIMSVASYFLVVFDRNDNKNVNAGFLYLVMTHIGTACIILGFLLLYRATGSFDFGAIKAGASLIPTSIKTATFVLMMIGLGTKAGIIPFHIWLPSAHPAAPSHVSGLMSGVMIKTGIYMMIRLFMGILQPIPSWWGLTIIVIGAVSSLLGVLYALTEHDIKRLLAYHSIENIGIILLGLGSALTFTSFHLPTLALLGLAAALFHTLNHATFKSLLFLGAGSVINQTHTRNMEEYGGIIRRMPQTALFFLIGSMAISALPPFNGFYSEWATYQSLFQGILVSNFSIMWILIAATGALALTGGLALACFVKAFGATFLARPRSEEAMHATESAFLMQFAMGSLAVLSLLFGLFAGTIVTLLERIGSDLGLGTKTPTVMTLTPGHENGLATAFASVSATWVFGAMLVAVFVVWFAKKYLVYRKQNVRTSRTWDCGTDLTPRMEITATGFARSIIMIFQRVLRPSVRQDITYFDETNRKIPTMRSVTLSITDVYRTYLYAPLNTTVRRLSVRVKGIQSGNINAYILYIAVALIVTLALVKSL